MRCRYCEQEAIVEFIQSEQTIYLCEEHAIDEQYELTKTIVEASKLLMIINSGLNTIERTYE